jgi:hypothetical protein
VIDFLATLDFVWRFLNPIGADVIKDRLKQKRLPEKVAATLAVGLYRSLRDVAKHVDEFIPALERLEELEKLHWQELLKKPTGWAMTEDLPLERDRHHASVAIEERAEEIIDALTAVGRHLGEIDPALSIHQPTLADLLETVTVSEALVATRTRKQVVPWLLTELGHVLNEARANQKRIAEGLEQYRQFVATEFSFKDLLG